MPILLSYQNRTQEFGQDAVHIGTDRANEVSFPGDARLQRRHAIIKKVATRWLVEGIEGALIQVGDQPEGRMHWLSPGDVIRLTPAGPEITFITAQVGSPTNKPQNKNPPARRQLVDRVDCSDHVERPELETIDLSRVDLKPVEIAKAPQTPVERSVSPPRAAMPRPVETDDDDDDDEDLPTFGRAVPRPPSIDDFAPAELAELKDLTPRPPTFKPAAVPTIEPTSANVEPPRLQVRPLPPAAVVVTSIPRVSEPEPFRRPPAPPKSNASLLSGILGMALSLAVAGYVWYPYLGWEFAAPAEAPARSKKSKRVVAEDFDEDADSEEHGGTRQSATTKDPANPAQAEARPPQRDIPSTDDVNAALAVVGIEQGEGQQRFRLGTAWVAGPKKLVTTAAIVLAIGELESAGAQPLVVFANSRTMTVVRRAVHPRYQELDRQFADEQTKLESLANQAAVVAEQHLQSLRDQQAEVDIGLLYVSEELPPGLLPSPITASPIMASPGSDLLAGFPFAVDDFRLPGDTLRPVLEVGTLPSVKRRPSFAVTKSRSDLNWAGSPLLNVDHQVVGIASGPDSSSTGVQLLVPIERLLEVDASTK